MSEKLYRAATGWIDKTLRGGKLHTAGIDGYVIIQKGNAKSLDKAIDQAKDVEGWIEEDGVPAHRPQETIKTIETH